MIDEADRLLDQSYHGWLSKVLKAAYNRQSTSGAVKNDRCGVHYKQYMIKIKQTNLQEMTVVVGTFQQIDHWEHIIVNFQQVVKISVNKSL